MVQPTVSPNEFAVGLGGTPKRRAGAEAAWPTGGPGRRKEGKNMEATQQLGMIM